MLPASDSDQQLVYRVRKGDAGAFELLLTRYQAAIQRHLLSIVHNEAAALDLTQEVALLLWQKVDQWSGQGSFKNWLFRIATNLALNYLRAERHHRQQPLELLSKLAESDEEDAENLIPGWMIDAAILGPAELVEQSEHIRLLRQLIANLPEEKREVWRLVHDAQMQTREVAEKLGIPEGTVKSRLHYATKRLAQQWEILQKEWEEI